jgi:hypothetical protein
MNDLLKEAIADAKAVKEVALANAKLALEEAFTPRLQSMLSKKLAEEAEAEEPVEEGEGEEETPVEEYGFYSEGEDEEPAMEEGEGEEEEAPMEEGEDEEAPVEEGEDEEAPVEEGEDEEEPMDEELMEIIRQLEEDIDSSEIGTGDNKKPSSVASDDSTEDKKEKLVQLVEEEDEDSEEVAEIKEILRALREEEGEEEPVEEGEDEEEVDIKEVLRALREEEEETVEEGEEGEEEKEVAESKLREAYAVISFLRSKINEVNLLNSKLLFSNKLFRKHSLSEKQKMSVIENFDRASSLREVKLVYTTLSESFRTTKVKPIKESFASKPTASTRPSKNILNEGDSMANRLRKLAGLK